MYFFHFYSISNRYSCQQTVKTLIRCRILHCLPMSQKWVKEITLTCSSVIHDHHRLLVEAFAFHDHNPHPQVSVLSGLVDDHYLLHEDDSGHVLVHHVLVRHVLALHVLAEVPDLALNIWVELNCFLQNMNYLQCYLLQSKVTSVERCQVSRVCYVLIV